MLVDMAREEFGSADSRYAEAIFQKANTNVFVAPDDTASILDDLDTAYAIEEKQTKFSILMLRIMLLKAKLFENKLNNSKQALSIYSKCLLIVQEQPQIEKELRLSLKSEIIRAIKGCGGKIDQSITFSEDT